MSKLNLYKVKKPYLSYPKGSIIQLDEEQAKQLIEAKIVEPIKPKKNKKLSAYCRKT